MKINTFLRLAAAASAPLLLISLFAVSDLVSAAPNLVETTSLPASHDDITGVPQIILSSYSGYVGDLIKVTGSGFAPGQVPVHVASGCRRPATCRGGRVAPPLELEWRRTGDKWALRRTSPAPWP